jgi:hypothetical protein
MARREYKPGLPTTLASAITSSDTSLTLTAYTNWPTGADGNFWVTIDGGTAQEERVLCSARSTASVTLATRGADGTTASAHSAGATIWPSWSATDADEANAHIESTGYASVSKTVHGLGSGDGVVVGTDKAQTLTAKTLTSPKINENVALLATSTELNILDGAVLSTTELNYVDGVTSAIQTQLDLLRAPATNAQTGTSYTLVLGDADKYVEMNNSSANVLTVPPNGSAAFPVGTQITVIQTGAGTTTITPGSGVIVNYYSLTGAATRTIKAQWAAATLIKRATDTWILIGNLG